MLFLRLIIGVAISYLIGSIPCAYLYGKLYKRLDIREHGSGNVGATNAFRVLGKGPGIAILLMDIAKGTIATTMVGDVVGLPQIVARVALGLAAVAGHNWTIFLGFNGGKGIATSLGVLIGLTIKVVALRGVVAAVVVIWAVVFLATRFVSLSSLVAAVCLPLLMAATNQSIELTLLGIIFCCFVVLRHRANIKRLLAREEPRARLRLRKHTS